MDESKKIVNEQVPEEEKMFDPSAPKPPWQSNFVNKAITIPRGRGEIEVWSLTGLWWVNTYGDRIENADRGINAIIEEFPDHDVVSDLLPTMADRGIEV